MPATNPTLDPEWSLLLAACSVVPREQKLDGMRTLVRGDIRWNLLFDLAERHGTLPLLHQAFLDIEELVPAEPMRSLKQSYQTNLHKSLLLSRELIRIVERLSALAVDVMPYKGVAVAEVVYGDIALRQSGDIDLLIRPQDLPRIRDAVRELGYMPHENLSEAEEHAYLESGYECAFDGVAGRNLLEVQWALQPRFYAVDFDMAGLFQRAMMVSVAGQPMKTPALPDLFLALSLHAAKHVWSRLIWLCDIARMMNLTTLNWNSIESDARNLGVARILRVTMSLAHRLLGAKNPSAQNSLSEDPAALTLTEEIQTQITSDAVYNVESLAYFRLMMRLRERQADRLRFLQRLIFTPGPGEWKAVRLPRPLFPLYRLVRLSRLAARLVQA